MKSSDAATAKMTEWLNGDPDKNPFARATTETVTVDIDSVVPQTDHTWLVDWTEKSYNRDGSLKQTTHMRATVSYYLAPPETPSEEQIRRNPLGIYISDFHWAKRLDNQER
jgi:type IV secretion system protein VirB5